METQYKTHLYNQTGEKKTSWHKSLSIYLYLEVAVYLYVCLFNRDLDWLKGIFVLVLRY